MMGDEMAHILIPEEPYWTITYPEYYPRYPEDYWHPEPDWTPQEPEWQIKTELQFTCPYCGKLIIIKWDYPWGYYKVYYCPHCGNLIWEKENECCDIQLEDSWNYCPMCGKKVKNGCGKMHRLEDVNGTLKCVDCGKEVEK